jgi:hypothetical protein
MAAERFDNRVNLVNKFFQRTLKSHLLSLFNGNPVSSEVEIGYFKNSIQGE